MAEPHVPDEETLQFPLVFPLKVMGRNDKAFATHVRNLLRPHLGEIADDAVESTESRNGSFVSLTVTFTATSRAQLDAIYETVTADPLVLYTL